MIARLIEYVRSRQNRHDLAVLLSAALAVYEGLHRAGVL